MEEALSAIADSFGPRPQAEVHRWQHASSASAERVLLGDTEKRVLAASLSGLSPHSCRVYTRHLTGYLQFLGTNGFVVSRESVEHYVAAVQETSSHNQALSACKRLAQQSAAHGWIDYGTSFSIGTIKARKLRGTRAGNWLAQQQAQALLNAPDPTILRGRRDRAVLALLLGTGIRRDELSRLDWSQIAQREGRPYIVDLLGKGNRLRTIAIPAWVMSIVLDWKNALDPNGRVVRSIRADGRIGTSLSASGIWNIVLQHSASAGLTCAPHDLRRSYAKLARKHGAPLDVIQKSLGHSSVSTTERYTNSGEQANAGDYFSL